MPHALYHVEVRVVISVTISDQAVAPALLAGLADLQGHHDTRADPAPTTAPCRDGLLQPRRRPRKSLFSIILIFNIFYGNGTILDKFYFIQIADSGHLRSRRHHRLGRRCWQGALYLRRTR